MRRQIFTIAILFVIANAHGGGALAQTNWRSIGSFPGYYFLSGYFWNARTGVVGDGHQFIYTRNGISWNTSSTFGLPVMASRMSMRCFDGKTVYAALLDNFGFAGGFAELWSSTDSGATWNRIQQIPLTQAHTPPLVNGVDVYWDYAMNAPVLCGTTVAQIGKYNLVASADDQALLPYYSTNGGHRWDNGSFLPPSTFTYGAGYGAWVDTVKHIFYACAEDGPPHIIQSLDSGMTWSYLPSSPPSPFIIDDLEGARDKLFVQGSTGVCMTSDGGSSWKSLGGPIRTQDDTRFCVFGCQGLAVVAFDDKGGIWMANDWDSPAPDAAVFSATGYECDSSTITIPLDSLYAPGPMTVAISDDEDSVFSLQSASNLSSPNGQILIRFSPRDVQNHTATITIAPLGYPGCDVIRHIAGKASLKHAVLSAQMPRVGCQPQTATFSINNPNCDRLHISNVTTSSPLLTISSFDSIISGVRSIPFECSPMQQSGLKAYTVRIRGTYEPSGLSFDSIFPISVQYAHVTSLLQSSISRIDFGSHSQCGSLDTEMVLENFGCDTLRVSHTQSLPKEWTITPSNDTVLLLPGDKDTIHIHFASIVPGGHDARLSYPYFGPYSDVMTVDLHTNVLATIPSVEIPVAEVDFGTRTICEPDTTVEIMLSNTGCDTIRIANSMLTSGIAFQLIQNADTILPPGGILDARVQYHPLQHGVALQNLALHISRLDGSMGRDTTISFSATIIRGSATIQPLVSAVNVGKTYICEERDTMLVFQNMGCDSVCVSSMEVVPPYFMISNKTAPSFCLGPGDFDTVYVRSNIDTTGAQVNNIATLQLQSDGDVPVAPVTLSREISYPASYSLALSPIPSIAAGMEIPSELIQHGILPPDVTAIDLSIIYNGDALQFLGVDEQTVIPSNYWRSSDGMGHLHFHISSLPSDSTLAHLHFMTYVSNAEMSTIGIDSIEFASSDSRPNQCIASIITAETSVSNEEGCGDNMLVHFLQGVPILLIRGVTPNPASNEITIAYTLKNERPVDAEISVNDVLGRCVAGKIVSLQGINNQESINVNSLPSGMYRIRISASGAITYGQFVKQ